MNDLTDGDKVFNLFGQITGDDILFLKLNKHAHQSEYRMVWFVAEPIVGDFIDVKCPEAAKFCTRFEAIRGQKTGTAQAITPDAAASLSADSGTT